MSALASKKKSATISEISRINLGKKIENIPLIPSIPEYSRNFIPEWSRYYDL